MLIKSEMISSVLILVLCTLSVVLCLFNKNNFLDRFDTEFNEFFDESIIPKLFEEEHFYLLNFPHSFLTELNNLDNFVPNDFVQYLKNHFKAFTINSDFYNSFLYRDIEAEMMFFCKKFGQDLVDEKRNTLRYPIDTDFLKYYLENVRHYELESSVYCEINDQIWKLVLKSFDEIMIGGRRFLLKCKRAGIFCIFADFAFFFESLKSSIEKVFQEFQTVHFITIISFKSQAIDAYFSSRFHDLQSLPRGRDQFIGEFRSEIDEFLLKLFESVEKFEGSFENVADIHDKDNVSSLTDAILDTNAKDRVNASSDISAKTSSASTCTFVTASTGYNTPNNAKGADSDNVKTIDDLENEWKIFENRILIAKDVFKTKLIPNEIALAGCKAVDEISKFCHLQSKNHANFDINLLKNYSFMIFKDFFQAYGVVIMNLQCSENLSRGLYEKLSAIYDFQAKKEPIVVAKKNDSSFERITNENQELIDNILNTFLISAWKLRETWRTAQIFEGDYIISNTLSYEIHKLIQDLDLDARRINRNLLPSPKHIVVQLKNLVEMGLEKMETKYLIYSEIFKDFVWNHFKEEFFDKFIYENESSHLDLEKISKEQILENPLQFLEKTKKLEGISKFKAVDYLLKTYSEFIEKEFSGISSELKDLIFNSVNKSLKMQSRT